MITGLGEPLAVAGLRRPAWVSRVLPVSVDEKRSRLRCAGGGGTPPAFAELLAIAKAEAGLGVAHRYVTYGPMGVSCGFPLFCVFLLYAKTDR